MKMSDCSDSSDEEILVYADFQDNISVEELITSDPSTLSVDFIGVDAEKPIIKLNGKFFKGKVFNSNKGSDSPC